MQISIRRFLPLLFAIWVVFQPIWMGAVAIRYQLALQKIAQISLGKADQIDRVCFSGAKHRLALKQEQQKEKQPHCKTCSVFFFYYLPPAQAIAPKPTSWAKVSLQVFCDLQAPLIKGFPDAAFHPPSC
jgi:hypothetical protein